MVIVHRLNKLKSPSPKDALCQVWLKSVQWFWRWRFYKFRQCILLFYSCFPWKKAWPFIRTNLNFHYPRMLCVKFGWNWHSGSGEEDEYVKSIRQRWQWRRTTKNWHQKCPLDLSIGSSELKNLKWESLRTPTATTKTEIIWKKTKHKLNTCINIHFFLMIQFKKFLIRNKEKVNIRCNVYNKK